MNCFFPGPLVAICIGSCVKLFYMKLFNYRGNVKKGDKIGSILPMQKVYSGITSHIHVQICDKSDLTPTCESSNVISSGPVSCPLQQ
ncbi:leukocyte cell-derived chemotaxin-2-like isoform X1 [Polyodon spathula]|uniref:leukocyte cell-derived chemotaxin-2-like isoform X1 n=1 Tax=Polyodon spathula TaxID=7913 RepID=UPI001B7EB06B|nr:leukocyte cell-derived chemotaxin-2-like isoform X1 [Polyodon spathula]